MTLFTYVVARDYGFAPNPFGYACTLATCKPDIRRSAQLGDWVAGTGSVANGQPARLVYALQVSEMMSFEQYWNDPRFQNKKPNLAASTKLAFGDNIYSRQGGGWHQLNSHHSLPGGITNPLNIERDTKANRVLVSNDFVYWGENAPVIPDQLRDFSGEDLCKKGPGHKNDFSPQLINAFVEWVRSFESKGYLGSPKDWK